MPNGSGKAEGREPIMFTWTIKAGVNKTRSLELFQKYAGI